MFTGPPGDVSQSSGTAVAPTLHHLQDEHASDRITQPTSTSLSESLTTGEEQALESHEVIELQTFSERKVWIEEKIKFLERMPPIEVFVGLDAVRSSAEHIPGLPTPEELKQWIVEHDAIEKETEIFDRGELTKLRQLTKAATQRNLSPADTDVIELTLTTIYELDKLLHLLRDRSENLELLGVRLTWEEGRIAAWVSRRNILDDIRTFLDTRVRWNPSIYENATTADDPPDSLKRRNSVTSLASASSDISTMPSGFSRSSRFKLAEVLSRDAAQFTGRVTSLKHGKITATGKCLDKLIDQSRKPVPEELLDEQDKLEEKGIGDMEHLGKFVMNMVTQWRKADELYVETMKDKTTAQNLFEEIETAKLHHPTARQNISFTSRADALIKRVAIRGNPASSTSTFPCPEHALFEEQKELNRSLAQSLSSEITSTTAITHKVSESAKAYRATFEAVRCVEALTDNAQALINTLFSIMTRVQVGVPAEDGDGSPPNLTSQACLEPSRHSVFLALFPSILQEFTLAAESSTQVIRSSLPALLALEQPGIDKGFKANAASVFEELKTLRNRVKEICDAMVGRWNKLKEARRINGLIGREMDFLVDISHRITDMMKVQRWQQTSGPTMGTNYQEYSPSTPLSVEAPHTRFEEEIHEIASKLTQNIDGPLNSLCDGLEDTLKSWLLQESSELNSLLSWVVGMAGLLKSIQHQTRVMKAVQGEFSSISHNIENTRAQITSRTDEVLCDQLTNGGTQQAEDVLQLSLETMQTQVSKFIEGLSDRISFVSQYPAPVSNGLGRKTAPLDVGSKRYTASDLPFDLPALDSVVRADSNSFAMRLNGQLESLTLAFSRFHLACMAKEIDSSLTIIIADINQVSQDLTRYRSALSDIKPKDEANSASLSTLLHEIQRITSDDRTRINHLFLPLRELLRRMERSPGANDPSVRDTLYATRNQAIDDVQILYQTWEDDVSALIDAILQQKKVEEEHMKQLRTAEENRQRKEAERLVAEAAERLRVAQEFQEMQEQARSEEEHRAAMLLEQLERERAAVQEAEKARQDHERAEERERRARMEVDRTLKEEAERTRLRQERLDIEEKLRLTQEQLAEERRFQAEDNRLAGEEIVQDNGMVPGEPNGQDVAPSKATEAKNPILQNDHREKDSNWKDPSTPVDTAKGLRARPLNEEDIFGLRVTPSENRPKKTKEENNLQAQVLAFRKRLRSMNINEIARPRKSSANLPGQDQLKKMTREFASISSGVSLLPPSVIDASVDVELQSLRAEIEGSTELMNRVEKLAALAGEIQKCDVALSDLLEHIDSYPAAPKSISTTSQLSLPDAPPEEQLTAHLAFTRRTIESMTSKFNHVSKDSRAIGEKSRILQTWSELEEMGYDRLGGGKSRPTSAISIRSSGRNSSASIGPYSHKKTSGYSNLSVSSTASQKRFLVPKYPTPRRAVSGGSVEPQSRPSSQTSTLSSNRAVSGPLGTSIYGSTYASRQRTASLSNSHSTPARNPSTTPMRSRAQTAQHPRVTSPTGSDVSSYSRPARPHARSSTSMSTWSRAPRDSLSSIAPLLKRTPPKKPVPPRKTYVANPQHKLDVAIGDVVNNLPVGINVEGVSETWKDQSGKYWIGNQDARLCFCRILRSQTVMVRVGGGWSELSKFIKDHFADSFRILPESPPRAGAPEEKWISSATLLEASVELDSPPAPQRTPEPAIPFMPTFSLSTPNGQSPRSMKSASNSPSAKGSPLTPLQFMRRADVDAILRPVTPSKQASTPLRPRNTLIQTPTPARNSIWRP